MFIPLVLLLVMNNMSSCWLQLNISFPATGCQKLIEVDDEKKLRTFYEKRMAQEVSAECLGDEWKVSVTWSCCHTISLLHTISIV